MYKFCRKESLHNIYWFYTTRKGLQFCKLTLIPCGTITWHAWKWYIYVTFIIHFVHTCRYPACSSYFQCSLSYTLPEEHCIVRFFVGLQVPVFFVICRCFVHHCPKMLGMDVRYWPDLSRHKSVSAINLFHWTWHMYRTHCVTRCDVIWVSHYSTCFEMVNAGWWWMGSKERRIWHAAYWPRASNSQLQRTVTSQQWWEGVQLSKYPMEQG